jgi:hypothetical protein
MKISGFSCIKSLNFGILYTNFFKIKFMINSTAAAAKPAYKVVFSPTIAF